MPWRRGAGRLLGCLAAIALLGGGVARLRDGLAMDAAIPVPNAMIAHIAMPAPAYRLAVSALQDADPANADALTARAEARLQAGLPPAAARADLAQALSDSPGSARAWTLLSEAWMPADREKAAKALSLALELAPYDFWLDGVRARDAARLWDRLDGDARASALGEVRILWDAPALRDRLLPLLASEGGAGLVTRAFAADRDTLRQLNRFVSAERRRLAPEPATP